MKDGGASNYGPQYTCTSSPTPYGQESGSTKITKPRHITFAYVVPNTPENTANLHI